MNITKESESYYSQFDTGGEDLDSEKYDFYDVENSLNKIADINESNKAIKHIKTGNCNINTEVDKDKINLLFDLKEATDLLQWILDEEGESLSSRVYNKINHFLNGK